MKAKKIRNRFFRVFIPKEAPVYFTNRKVKDRLFRYIFSRDKEALLQLYNALNDTHYTDAQELEMITAESVVYMAMKNDMAFILYGVIQLYEHQGSYNPNMPVRFLIYLGQEYEKIITRRKENIYGTKLIKLPAPQCIVFYNGEKEVPEVQQMRLSDAFENKEQHSSVEVTVHMLNINFGYNKELMEKCRKLYEYSYYVDQIRQRINKGMPLKEAIEKAASYCVNNDILADILEEHRMEVVGMLLTEFNERKHWKMVSRAAWEEGLEEGREKGLQEGREEGRKEGYQEAVKIFRMYMKGKSMEEIAEKTRIPYSKIEKMLKDSL